MRTISVLLIFWGVLLLCKDSHGQKITRKNLRSELYGIESSPVAIPDDIMLLLLEAVTGYYSGRPAPSFSFSDSALYKRLEGNLVVSATPERLKSLCRHTAIGTMGVAADARRELMLWRNLFALKNRFSILYTQPLTYDSVCCYGRNESSNLRDIQLPKIGDLSGSDPRKIPRISDDRLTAAQISNIMLAQAVRVYTISLQLRNSMDSLRSVMQVIQHESFREDSINRMYMDSMYSCNCVHYRNIKSDIALMQRKNDLEVLASEMLTCFRDLNNAHGDVLEKTQLLHMRLLPKREWKNLIFR
jgi:hypothetical protein